MHKVKSFSANVVFADVVTAPVMLLTKIIHAGLPTLDIGCALLLTKTQWCFTEAGLVMNSRLFYVLLHEFSP